MARQSIEMGMDVEPKALLKEIEDVRRRLSVYEKHGEADKAYETEPANSEVVK